ncbi:hypothetical protein [Flyfo microvirus Tbat2_160]|nr:hypothetical protein [Flyfo microvirus Tbat2_160]
MKKRQKVPAAKSKRLFTRTAKKVHPKNAMSRNVVMRGGIRL